MKKRNLGTSFPTNQLIALALLAIPGNVIAQKIQGNEIVITPARVQEKLLETPYSLRIINEKDIESSNAFDAQDLLAEESLGHVHKLTTPGTDHFRLRGLQSKAIGETMASNVVILVNGQRAGSLNLTKIPARIIQRMEILRGPSSVMYGGSATGGVINVITKEAKSPQEAYLSAGAGSFSQVRSAVEAGVNAESWGTYAAIQGQSRSSYSINDAQKYNNSAYRDFHGFLSLQREIGGGLLKTAFMGWDMPKSGSPGAFKANGVQNQDQTAMRWLAAQAQWQNTWLAFSGFYNTDSYQTFNAETTTIDQKTYGGTLLTNLNFAKQTAILGIDLNQVKLSGTRESSTSSLPPYNPNATQTMTGLFSEAILRSPGNTLGLNLGARIDLYNQQLDATPEYTSLSSNTSTGNYTTWRAGGRWSILDGLTLKANTGTGIRVPQPSELATDYSYSTGFGPQNYTGNPNLKPETSLSVDLGLVYLSNAIEAEVNTFQNTYENKISSSSSDFVNYTFSNLPKVVLAGIETDLAFELLHYANLNNQKLWLFGKGIWHYRNEEAESQNPSGRLPYTPTGTVTAGLRFSATTFGGSVYAKYLGREDYQDWANQGGAWVNQGDLGTIASLNFWTKPIDALSLRAELNNIFDKKVEYVAGYPIQGRNFQFSMTYQLL